MDTRRRLLAEYGEWMSAPQVGAEIGRKVVRRCDWPLRNCPTKKCLRAETHRVISLYDTRVIAERIEQHEREEAEKKHYDKTLCQTCIYRDFLSGLDRTLTCAYSAHPGHNTRTWHAKNDIPNALDMANCPFYIEGDQKPIPRMDVFPRHGGRRAFDT